MRNLKKKTRLFTEKFYERVLFIRVFSADGHYRMKTIASRDRFKPIANRENLVVNYNNY